MKTISSALLSHLADDSLTLALCWKLVRRDGEVMGFTSHDQNLTIDSVVFEAASGIMAGDAKEDVQLKSDTHGIEGLLDSDAISEADVIAGLYDHAEIELFMVNYKSVSDGAIHLRTGWLGEVTMDGERFSATLYGLTNRFEHTVGQLYAPTCRATLGDNACGVVLASYTQTGTITSVTSKQAFVDSARTEAEGYFNQGVLEFTSGSNEGLKMEVKTFGVSGDFTLVLPMANAVQIGDTYSVSAGCNKTSETCLAKFNNLLNFRGEPFIPGVDRVLQNSVTSR